MLDEESPELVLVDAAPGQGLVEAAVGAAELGFETQRRDRPDRSGDAQGGVGQLEQGVTPPGQAAVEPGPESFEFALTRLSHSRQYDYCLLAGWGYTGGGGTMARTTPEQRLATYERRYRELATQLAGIGLISSGSITRRYTRCTTSGCKCRADPPQPHGPYWQWTRKVDGKTVTRRLTPTEAKLYREWIDNDRRMRRLIDQMRTVAAKAAELRLAQASQQASKV